MYTEKQLEKALSLHTHLVRSGLDADFAELRVLRSLDRIENEPVEEIAQEIVEGAADRWKEPRRQDQESNFYDELRRRIAEEKSRRAPNAHDARAELTRRLEGRTSDGDEDGQPVGCHSRAAAGHAPASS